MWELRPLDGGRTPVRYLLAGSANRSLTLLGYADTLRHRAPDPVFRGEERHELDVGSLVESVDRAATLPIETRLVGDQTDPASTHQVARIRQQDIDAGQHAVCLRAPSVGGLARPERRCGSYEGCGGPPSQATTGATKGSGSL